MGDTPPIVAPVSVAIIGLGRIGAQFNAHDPRCVSNYATAARRNSEGLLALGVDPSPDQRRRFVHHYRVPAVASINEISGLGVEPDLVIVSPPTEYLVSTTSEALKLFPNAYILVEKPLAHTRESMAICDNWPEKKVRVGYTRAYIGSTVWLKEKLQSDALGAVTSISGRYSRGFANNASHILDLVQRLFGFDAISLDFVEIGDAWHPPRDLSILARGLVDVPTQPNAAPITIRPVDDRHRTIADLDILFERGRVQYLHGGRRITVSAASSSTVLRTDMDVSIGDVMDELIKWVRREPSLGCSLREGRSTSQLLLQAMDS